MNDGSFPAGFLWGVATSAYQIEGAVSEDGRGESIWDRFCRIPGRIANGETGDVACDHYHRYADDVALLADLGVHAYRFSICWPRLFPDGGTRLNRKGLEFYERLVDLLLERRIAPAVTLYHWDLPQALQDRGGWTNRETVSRFSHYAAAVFDALGDRVALWITHNEPWMASFIGHLRGVHAPGLTDLQAALRAAHHILLSHGEAVQAHRAAGVASPIGIALNLFPTYPVSSSAEDRVAAEASKGYTNRWFLDPIFRREYPADTAARFEQAGASIDFIADGDLQAIASPIDFLGVNYYSPRRVSAADEEFGWRVQPASESGAPLTAIGGEISPYGLTDLLLEIGRDYGSVPLYVTENGCALEDTIAPDGGVHDQQRIDFLERHFAAARRAIDAGVDLRGFFVWSLLDNFEWALGYAPRFGIVYVDYATQRRIPKGSFRFYRDMIAGSTSPR
ncbi:MAG: GH1 family beta-glucosidase [Chloroflexota bacterium]|nr:GH1 family beta-glucosidase [Chloroflexota bacterium]